MAYRLRFMKTTEIINAAWLTRDVHYAVLQSRQGGFLISIRSSSSSPGPFHTGTFGPAYLDNAFGPEERFVKAPEANRQNLPRTENVQFFADVYIDGGSDDCLPAGPRPSLIRKWDSAPINLFRPCEQRSDQAKFLSKDAEPIIRPRNRTRWLAMTTQLFQSATRPALGDAAQRGFQLFAQARLAQYRPAGKPAHESYICAIAGDERIRNF